MQTARSCKELKQRLKKQGIDVVFVKTITDASMALRLSTTTAGGAERFTFGQGVFGERVQRTLFGRNRKDAPDRSTNITAGTIHASRTAGLRTEN